MKVSIGPSLVSISVKCSITSSPCLTSRSRCEPVRLLRIDDGDHAHAAAFAMRPAPGEGHEGAPLAGHLVELAADILDPRNAVAHEDFVRRLPMGKIVEDIAAGRHLYSALRCGMVGPVPCGAI